VQAGPPAAKGNSWEPHYPVFSEGRRETQGLAGAEALADVARVLSSYSDAIVLRTFSQKLIEDFAQHASCPVINGLSDERHPCQALTDYFTIREVFGKDLRDKKVVYIGDGNNVAISLATAAAIQKLPITICAPAGYEIPTHYVDQIVQQYPGTEIETVSDPVLAVRNADIVYTDVWASMGQESQAEEKNRLFAPYQVNELLMANAHSDCRFMHCLPARRGVEVDDITMDNSNSVVFQQAENRLHLAKGLLAWLLQKRHAAGNNGRPARKPGRSNRRVN